MKYRQIPALLLCSSLFALAACSDDPMSGEGDVVDVQADKALVVAAPGDTIQITAYALDANSSRVAGQVNFTPFGAAVVVDSTQYLPELAETRGVFIVAGNANAGTGVVLEAGGVQDTLHIVIATPGTVNGSPALIFRSPIPVFTDEIHAEVAGADAVVLSQTATELGVLLPYGASGETSYAFSGFGATGNQEFDGAVILAPGPENEASEPNDSRATAAQGTFGVDIYGSLSDTDTDDYYVFTATEAGTYDFSIDWNDDSDVDGLIRNDAGAFINVSMATSNHPEHTTHVLAAGQTIYVQVNMYTFEPVSLPVTTYTLNVHLVEDGN
jgi:hypothetical protein